jgi:hypothetical protein
VLFALSGLCSLVLQTGWSTRCYPGCFFTTAPVAALSEALATAAQQENAPLVKCPRTSMTGVYLIPPRTQWVTANRIREAHFDDLRLGPHVSLVDPFIVPEQLPRACNLIQSQLAHIEPFVVRFVRFQMLIHSAHSITVYAVPEDDPPGSLQSLVRRVKAAIPICDDLLLRGCGDALLAHMSVARARSVAQAQSLIEQLEREWIPIEFRVGYVEVCLVLSRFHCG